MSDLTELGRVFMAREILDDNLISPVEIRSGIPGVNYDHDQISGCRDTMPSRDMLQWCAENQYMLVAGPPEPLSLLDILDRWPGYFYSGPGASQFSSEDDAFARNDVVDWGWIGLRIGTVPGSMGLSKIAQYRRLEEVETVPNVAQALWSMIVFQRVRGLLLDLRYFVRTSSVDSAGDSICIGGHGLRGQSGFHFRRWNSTIERPDLGLAACLSRVAAISLK